MPEDTVDEARRRYQLYLRQMQAHKEAVEELAHEGRYREASEQAHLIAQDAGAVAGCLAAIHHLIRLRINRERTDHA